MLTLVIIICLWVDLAYQRDCLVSKPNLHLAKVLSHPDLGPALPIL